MKDKQPAGNGYVGSWYAIQTLPWKKLTICPSREQWGKTPQWLEIGSNFWKKSRIQLGSYPQTKYGLGDETGVQNVPKEVKVLGVKHIRTFQQVSSEQGETSTVLSFVSTGGKVCPPLVIHKGQRVQETWRMKAPGDILLSATMKGYITKSRFHQYGVHFIKFLKHEGAGK